MVCIGARAGDLLTKSVCTHIARTLHANDMEPQRSLCKSNVGEIPIPSAKLALWRILSYLIETAYNQWLIAS
jgi:hypothetical protein